MPGRTYIARRGPDGLVVTVRKGEQERRLRPVLGATGADQLGQQAGIGAIPSTPRRPPGHRLHQGLGGPGQAKCCPAGWLDTSLPPRQRLVALPFGWARGIVGRDRAVTCSN